MSYSNAVTMNKNTSDGFSVNHSNFVVSVYKKVPGDSAEFDVALSRAHEILSGFRMSRAGSIWGCDGIGYMIQKQSGNVSVKKSGVGPRKAKEGFEKLV
jgi:hypothetical protein